MEYEIHYMKKVRKDFDIKNILLISLVISLVVFTVVTLASPILTGNFIYTLISALIISFLLNYYFLKVPNQKELALRVIFSLFFFYAIDFLIPQSVIFTKKEFSDAIIIIVAIGYIFNNVFKPKVKNIVDYYMQTKAGFNWNDFLFACAVVAPAIIIHELGHKICALLLGLTATFHAAYTWLGIGILLKLLNFGFIFFVPAYVEIQGTTLPIYSSLIAFMGPFVNLAFWIIASLILRTKKISQKAVYFWFLVKRINMFLFIFNMLPIPGFDGFKVYSGIISTIF